MPRGTNHDSNLDFAVRIFTAAIEERIVLFSAEVGVSAHWVAQRVAALLSPPGAGLLDQLPAVRGAPAGIRGTVEPLALAVHAHIGEAPPAVEAQPKPRRKSTYWDKLTPEERAKEMARRLRKSKWGKPKTKAGLRAKSLKSKANGHGKAVKSGKKAPLMLNERQKAEKQKIYVARSLARKQGLPLPPLPPKLQPSPTVM